MPGEAVVPQYVRPSSCTAARGAALGPVSEPAAMRRSSIRSSRMSRQQTRSSGAIRSNTSSATSSRYGRTTEANSLTHTRSRRGSGFR